MEEQIRDCKHLSLDDSMLFSSLFKTIALEQNSLFSRLQDNMTKIQGTETPFSVVTCVAPTTDEKNLQAQGFYPIIPINPSLNTFFPVTKDTHLTVEEHRINNFHVTCGFAFFHCQYDKINQYLEKEYQGEYKDSQGNVHSVKYSLKKSDKYLNAEEILFQTTRKLNVSTPPIYSPMARRCVEILIHCGDDLPMGGEVSFLWEENQLASVLITDSILYWNLSQIHSDELPSLKSSDMKILPFYQNVYQLWEYTLEEDEFLWIKDENYQIKREKNKLYIGFEENGPREDVEFRKLKIHTACQNLSQIAQITTPLFATGFQQHPVKKERIVTQADLFFVVTQFQELGLRLSDVKPTFIPDKNIMVYQKIDSYFYEKNPFPKKVTALYLSFEKNENDLYFTDKVSFLLDYLNHFYPEFRYVGVFP